jgi:hypothetical protein
MHWDVIVQLVEPFWSIRAVGTSHTIPAHLDSRSDHPYPFNSDRAQIKITRVTVDESYL